MATQRVFMLACNIILHYSAAVLEDLGSDVLPVLWRIGKLLHSLREARCVHAIVPRSKCHRGLLQREGATAHADNTVIRKVTCYIVLMKFPCFGLLAQTSE